MPPASARPGAIPLSFTSSHSRLRCAYAAYTLLSAVDYTLVTCASVVFAEPGCAGWAWVVVAGLNTGLPEITHSWDFLRPSPKLWDISRHYSLRSNRRNAIHSTQSFRRGN